MVYFLCVIECSLLLMILLLLLVYSTWMDGPMSGVDPDVVENDIGVVWRTLYKLEKGFSENPSALKMAQKVKGRVDDFKEYLGLIGALFNPGLRERHWDKMSQIANQDLKPNEVEAQSCIVHWCCLFHLSTCCIGLLPS